MKNGRCYCVPFRKFKTIERVKKTCHIIIFQTLFSIYLINKFRLKLQSFWVGGQSKLLLIPSIFHCGTVHVTMQPKSKLLLVLIDSIATSPVKLMHLKVFGCYMHGTLKTWSVHPPQPKPELEPRARTRDTIRDHSIRPSMYYRLLIYNYFHIIFSIFSWALYYATF